MDKRDELEDGMLLTQEEEASLHLLEPFFARYFDPILETLSSHLGSDSNLTLSLSDGLAVARLKRSQQAYLLSLLSGENEGSVGRDGAQAAEYCDPFGLGAGRHLRSVAHFLTSIQPLVFEAFGTRPRLHHTVWNALQKAIFHDLELALSASLKQRDDLVEASAHDASEARRILEFALNMQAAEEEQRQAEHRTVVRLLTTWLTKTSELAQEMGTPLNVILGRAESLLERTKDEKTHASLQDIVKQVERLTSLRQKLCNLDHGCGREPDAPDLKTMTEGHS